jgi:hypothetical protein
MNEYLKYQDDDQAIQGPIREVLSKGTNGIKNSIRHFYAMPSLSYIPKPTIAKQSNAVHV